MAPLREKISGDFQDMKLSKGKKLALTALGLIIVAGAVTVTLWTQRAAAEDFITAKIERGNIRHSVTATGTLQAVTTVQVGTQVSGTISALYADFNTQVHKGQVIARLDPAQFQAQLAQANATWLSAQATQQNAQNNVLAADAAIQSAQANVDHADAALKDAQTSADRTRKLVEAGVG